MGKSKRFNKKNAKRLVLQEKPLKPYINSRSPEASPRTFIADKRTEMTRLAEESDVEGFQEAWLHGEVDIKDLEYPDPASKGLTPMGVALLKFDKGRRPQAARFVQALLDKGLDVRCPVDGYGSTVLHLLSRQHRDAQTREESKALKDLYYWLVDQGADQLARDRASKTAMDYSVDHFLKDLMKDYGRW